MASRLVAKQGQWIKKASANRTFAAKAAAANLPEASVAKADNGVSVVAADGPSKLATVGVVVRAGPRDETYASRGASHALREATALASRRFTALDIHRSLQQQGAVYGARGNREFTFYYAQMHRDNLDEAMDFFLDAVTAPGLKPWEVQDDAARVAANVAAVCPATKAQDLLHLAAYRQGMGFSVQAPDYLVGKLSPSLLQSFYNKTYTAPRTALVGVGVSQRDLEMYAPLMTLEAGQGPESATKYCGGEERRDAAEKRAYVSVGAVAAGGNDVKACVAGLLLAKVLGTDIRVKWGSGAGKLQQKLSGVSANSSVTGFHNVYTDTALLGANIVAHPAEAGKIVSEVAAALRSLSVTAEELAAAKKGMINEAYSKMLENPLDRAENMGMQILANKSVHSLSSVPDMINSCTLGEVQAAAKKIAGSKLSLGAYGNLETVPYLDSL